LAPHQPGLTALIPVLRPCLHCLTVPCASCQALAPQMAQRPEATATASYRTKRLTATTKRVQAAEPKLVPEVHAAPATYPSSPDPFESIDPLELEKFHMVLQTHFTTRFAEMRRAFRMLDQTQSGMLSRNEVKLGVHLFNLSVGSTPAGD